MGIPEKELKKFYDMQKLNDELDYELKKQRRKTIIICVCIFGIIISLLIGLLVMVVKIERNKLKDISLRTGVVSKNLSPPLLRIGAAPVFLMDNNNA